MPLSGDTKGLCVLYEYNTKPSISTSRIVIPELTIDDGLGLWAWTCHIKSPLTWLSGNDTAGIHVDNTNLHVSNISALRPSERE